MATMYVTDEIKENLERLAGHDRRNLVLELGVIIDEALKSRNIILPSDKSNAVPGIPAN